MDQQVAEAIWIRSGNEPRQELDEGQIEKYWTAVSETLRRVMDIDAPSPIIHALRERLGEAGAETQVFFYHSSPLQVASNVVGIAAADLTSDQVAAYSEIVEEFEATLDADRSYGMR